MFNEEACKEYQDDITTAIERERESIKNVQDRINTLSSYRHIEGIIDEVKKLTMYQEEYRAQIDKLSRKSREMKDLRVIFGDGEWK